LPPDDGRQLSDAEKLRKVIVELVETERTYVKVSRSWRPSSFQLLVASFAASIFLPVVFFPVVDGNHPQLQSSFNSCRWRSMSTAIFLLAVDEDIF
jgi:hypothetical protein